MKNIVVPELGESISEATVLTWFKKPGEAVAMDEALVELETDKVTVEVNAPAAGVLQDISAEEGAVVKIGDVIGAVDETATAPTPQEAKEADEHPKAEATQEAATPKAAVDNRAFSGPAVTKQLAEQGLKPTDIKAPSGRGGRITPEDVHRHMREKTTQVAHASEAEERVPMSRLRQKIAERLKAAQNTAAILTTFNEVDMSAVMGLRAKYKDEFAKVHGVKLGFMSFFVKACVKALQEFPAVNAAIDGTDIVFKKNYHIGVAVGTDRGLVVPVVRHAEQLSLADIEREIGRLGALARDGKLEIADLQGGTFSISNGGVYGSLLSTPILNAPQSGILGMHKIEKRAVVVNDEVAVRPMMYLALSYDHRIIDGREAVTFLTKIKEALEEPERMLLNL